MTYEELKYSILEFPVKCIVTGITPVNLYNGDYLLTICLIERNRNQATREKGIFTNHYFMDVVIRSDPDPYKYKGKAINGRLKPHMKENLTNHLEIEILSYHEYEKQEIQNSVGNAMQTELKLNP